MFGKYDWTTLSAHTTTWPVAGQSTDKLLLNMLYPTFRRKHKTTIWHVFATCLRRRWTTFVFGLTELPPWHKNIYCYVAYWNGTPYSPQWLETMIRTHCLPNLLGFHHILCQATSLLSHAVRRCDSFVKKDLLIMENITYSTIPYVNSPRSVVKYFHLWKPEQ